MNTAPLPQDEVIRMARKAGLYVGTNISGVMLVGSSSTPGIAHIDIDEMTAFATVARADLEAEVTRLREALKAILDEQDANQGYATLAKYDAARAALENKP